VGTTRLRSRGGLLEVEPGDVLRIRLHNRLEAPTNLHTNGLHVRCSSPDQHHLL
jgi:FtsP/CotA-like multicopper oxidase with cupredoxin domain